VYRLSGNNGVACASKKKAERIEQTQQTQQTQRIQQTQQTQTAIYKASDIPIAKYGNA
jgi:hypothetical protein